MEPQPPLSNAGRVNKAMRDDALLWTMANISLPRGAKWSFTGERKWQRALFQDPARQLVLRKSAQVGISTTAVCRMLHFLVYHPAHAMYTLPRRDDVNDFVVLYVDPIIANSHYLRRIRELIEEKSVDNARIKQFRVNQQHSSFVIFMEASVEPRMIPVDFMINDEIDRSDADNIEIFAARQANSQHKINYKFSTPSLENAGIDPYFLTSTQNYWHVRCGKCNYWNMLDWDTNFREPSLNHGPHLACARCQAELSPEDVIEGQWVSMGPRGEEVPSGYQISNLLMPYSRPIATLYDEYRKTKSVKNFYNLNLGMPYRTSTNSFSYNTFRSRSFTEPYPREEERQTGTPYFVGIDQANDLHVVVGREHHGKLRIVNAAHIPFERRNAFELAGQLIERMEATAIIDGGPNRHPARQLQEGFPRGRIYLSSYGQYREEFSHGKAEFGGDNGMVNISRTEAFDDLRDAVARGIIQLWGKAEPMEPQVVDIIKQCLAIKRDEVLRIVNGVEETRVLWRPTGPDHYAHALLFCYMAWKFIAARRYEVVALGVSDEQEQAIISTYERRMNDLLTHVAELQEADRQEERTATAEGRPLRVA